VFIGGDHSVTYSTFQGAKSRVDRETKIGLIHFDAHFDVEDDYPNLPRVWHGNVFRALIDEGHITGKDLFTIGVRGIVPKKWVDYADAKEINYFTSDQLKQHKDDVIGKIATGLAAYDQVYVTMDVDSLDISQCPGTGTPRANGLMPGDIVDITRSCIIQPLLGVDIVEYSPLYDQNGQSAVTICEIMYDILAFRSRR
jgi:arginase family enzyme